LTSTGQIFMNFIFECFSKTCSLKSDKYNRYFTWSPIYIFYLSRWIHLRMRIVSDLSWRQIHNTHFMFNHVFQRSCCSWDNAEKAVEPGRLHMTIWCMWIPKATTTHLLLNTYCFSSAIMVAWMHLIVMLCCLVTTILRPLPQTHHQLPDLCKCSSFTPESLPWRWQL
jgi:hypothetical protein